MVHLEDGLFPAALEVRVEWPIFRARPQAGLNVFRGKITDLNGQFLVAGVTAQLLDQVALGAQQAGDCLEQVHRMRIVRACSAIERLMDWRIHQVGIGAELEAAARSNLLTARNRPRLPSWIRSSSAMPRPRCVWPR